MKETYTFSRALHMMRYGGKKMKSISDSTSYFYFVKDLTLYVGHTKCSDVFFADDIDVEDIMGNWVEVKDEKC